VDVTVTNISAAPVPLGDIYTTIPVGGSVTFKRSASQISAMVSLQKAVTAQQVTVLAVEEAFETASGLATAPGTIAASDMAPVAAADAAAAPIEFRKSFAALGAGVADDVVVFAANTLPYKIRVTNASARIVTAIGASTINVYDQAAGAGQLCASLSSAATGIVAMTGPNASVVVAPGALIGLFIRRSDRGVAGEVVITARRES
jgi:hypothetical protein